MRTMIRYFSHYKLLSGIFLFSTFIEVLYAVAAPLSLKYLVDEAFTPRDFQAFVIILFVLLGGGFLSICASVSGDYSLGKLGGEVIRQMRTDLFRHLQRQSLYFYQRYRTGDLVTRFISDMSSIERVIRFSCPFFLKEISIVILGIVMLFSIEWKLTFIMLIGSALMFVGPRLLQGRAEMANISYKKAQEHFSNTIDEVAKGHKTIKSLYQQNRFGKKADQHINELFSTGMRLHIVNSLMERLPLTTLLILNGIMIGLGGYFIFNGEMTVGGFMAFFTLFMSVGQSGSNLTFLIPNIIDSSISFRRIGEIMDQQSDVPEMDHPGELPFSTASVTMDKVTFGYTEGVDQLKDVSLHIPAGSYIAFVGPSGSGKSTALQLLSRFYDPKEGSVLVNGHDLRTVSDESLRKLSTMVTQETFLFNDSIRNNLLLDNADTTDEDMIQVTQEVKIHQAISSWSEGYNTWIYGEGGPLSGGERQRLSLARALLRRPKLLLLDEVTSALDAATEADISQLIQDIRGRTTVVSVTHRLTSIVNADMIYVFNEGRVTEFGTHQELLQQAGLYKSLWEKQRGAHFSSLLTTT